MADLRPFVDGPRLFAWTPDTPPPPALAAFLLRADTPSGLASFLTPETVLPRGVVAQFTVAVSRGDPTPTEAGRRFLATLRNTKEARDG